VATACEPLPPTNLTPIGHEIGDREHAWIEGYMSPRLSTGQGRRGAPGA
jgi:hypothetical protein